jgi:DnaA family protein
VKQLALGISPPPQPSLDNFIPGRNAELLARLRELHAGRVQESIVYLWGPAGSGRSHLLRATARHGLRIADDVEQLDEPAQIELFNAINQARESGGAVLAAGHAPPAQLALRDDLRSRLGWGLVYQLQPLTDDERMLYLRSEADRRGMHLADDVIAYLLTRLRRDLPSLSAVLDRLDRVSLELQRPVTLPLARDILKDTIE